MILAADKTYIFCLVSKEKAVDAIDAHRFYFSKWFNYPTERLLGLCYKPIASKEMMEWNDDNS